MTIRSLTSLRTALATGFVFSLATSASAQSNWVDFVEVTATNLTMVTVDKDTDDEEKDMSPGDFDRDGDTDLIVVRKVPFTVAGPRTNVLLMNVGGVLVERTSQYFGVQHSR